MTRFDAVKNNVAWLHLLSLTSAVRRLPTASRSGRRASGTACGCERSNASSPLIGDVIDLESDPVSDDANDRVIVGDGRQIVTGGDHVSAIDVSDFDFFCGSLACRHCGNVDRPWDVTFPDLIAPDHVALVVEKAPMVVSHG